MNPGARREQEAAFWPDHRRAKQRLRAVLLVEAERRGWPPVDLPGGKGLPGRRDVWERFADLGYPDELRAALGALGRAKPFPPDELPPICSGCGHASWWSVDHGRSWLCGWCRPPASRPGMVTWWGERPMGSRKAA